MNKNQTCEACFKIVCKQCGWEASDEEVCQIQIGELTACPVCGWMPGESVSRELNKNGL